MKCWFHDGVIWLRITSFSKCKELLQLLISRNVTFIEVKIQQRQRSDSRTKIQRPTKIRWRNRVLSKQSTEINFIYLIKGRGKTLFYRKDEMFRNEHENYIKNTFKHQLFNAWFSFFPETGQGWLLLLATQNSVRFIHFHLTSFDESFMNSCGVNIYWMNYWTRFLTSRGKQSMKGEETHKMWKSSVTWLSVFWGGINYKWLYEVLFGLRSMFCVGAVREIPWCGFGSWSQHLRDFRSMLSYFNFKRKGAELFLINKMLYEKYSWIN